MTALACIFFGSTIALAVALVLEVVRRRRAERNLVTSYLTTVACERTIYALACQIHGRAAVDREIADAEKKGSN